MTYWTAPILTFTAEEIYQFSAFILAPQDQEGAPEDLPVVKSTIFNLTAPNLPASWANNVCAMQLDTLDDLSTAANSVRAFPCPCPPLLCLNGSIDVFSLASGLNDYFRSYWRLPATTN